MFFEDRYKDWVFSEEQVRKIVEAHGHNAIVSNDIIEDITVAVHLHFNAVLLKMKTRKSYNILPTIKCDSRIGHIIRFLVDVLQIESEGVDDEVPFSKFKKAPIRVVYEKENSCPIAIGNLLNDQFFFIDTDYDHSMWEVDK